MNTFEQLKKLASENCGACGDAHAVLGNTTIVAFGMNDGSFIFHCYIDGAKVEPVCKIKDMLEIGNWSVYGPADSRNFAA